MVYSQPACPGVVCVVCTLLQSPPHHVAGHNVHSIDYQGAAMTNVVAHADATGGWRGVGGGCTLVPHPPG